MINTEQAYVCGAREGVRTCVAVMTGFPRMLALLIIIFWARNTCVGACARRVGMGHERPVSSRLRTPRRTITHPHTTIHHQPPPPCHTQHNMTCLLGGDLHAEVPAGHHDAVRLGENVVVVVEPLLVLNLGDDLSEVWSIGSVG